MPSKKRTNSKGSLNKKRFIVQLDLPQGASIKDALCYIDEAVSVWCGSLCPDEDMFHLDRGSVKVTQERKRHKRPPKETEQS